VRVAKLRGPGEIEEVEVEGLRGGGFEGKRGGAGARNGFGRGLGVRVTGRERKKKAEEDGDRSLLHGGSISGPLVSRRERTGLKIFHELAVSAF
jgi:hypothetical protein